MTKNIVYIDDEKDLGFLFKELLEGLTDCVIECFSDATKAAQFIKRKKISAVFIDYRMPEQNGDELAKQLPKDLPKYLVTGELDVQNLVDVSLFKGIITKPFDPDELQAVIDKIIKETE